MWAVISTKIAPSHKEIFVITLLCIYFVFQVAMGNVYQVKNHNDMNQDLTNSEYHCKLVEGRKMPDKDFDVTLPYGKM